jgi:hypothetical protein
MSAKGLWERFGKWTICARCGILYLEKNGHRWGVCQLIQADNRQKRLNLLKERDMFRREGV